MTAPTLPVMIPPIISFESPEEARLDSPDDPFDNGWLSELSTVGVGASVMLDVESAC